MTTTALDHLLGMPWASAFTAAQRERLAREVLEREVPAGTAVCRHGLTVNYWKGVIGGLVKLSVEGSDGRTSTLTGLHAGAWFGEGPVLRAQPWEYDGVALRPTRLALVPRATFLWLVRESPGFNDFVLGQLAERLAQFVAIIEAERLANAPVRVVRSLAWLFNPVLYPGQSPRLDLTQQEIAYLSGVTRQRVNQSLRMLERAGLLATGYGSVEVLDLPGLLAFKG